MMKQLTMLNLIRIGAGAAFAVAFGAYFFTKYLPRDSVQIYSVTDGDAPAQVKAAESSPGHSLKPVVSNQWYSNVFAKFPSQPFYAFPLAYQITADGLGFSYPELKYTSNTIFAPYDEDITVGLSSALQKPEITHIGDWSFSVKQTTKSGDSLEYTLGQGIPYTTVVSKSKKLTIEIPNQFTISGSDGAEISKNTLTIDTVVVKTRGHFYLLASPSPFTMSKTKKELVISDAASLVVALMDSPEHISDFKRLAGIHIADTRADFDVTGSSVRTTYRIATNDIVPLVALMPHQYETISGDVTELGSYKTLRGTLKLVRASTFSTTVPFNAPPAAYTKASTGVTEIAEQIRRDAAKLLKEPVPDSRDYYLGAWMGKITTVIQLADAYGLQKEKQQLIDFLKPVLIKSTGHFAYDDKMTSMIAKKPEFGNEKLNDHHFHNGYFIRTAAVLSQYDPALLEQIKDDIDELVADIVSTDRRSDTYPYLRNYNVYESHSYADGFAHFADGSNQESSSEAVNAWYAVYLWSEVTKNPQLKTYASALYANEIQGAQYYWFDKTGIYTEPYKHRIASIVWGGKVDFATWFSDSTNMKYGIQLLPYTPASGYLADMGRFDDYAEDFTASKGDITKEWGDLFVMWESMYHPEEALGRKDKVTKYEGNNTKSAFLHMLYSSVGK